jgi:uncharacterized protein YcaQ
VADEISADDARRMFLRAQGVLGAPDRRAGVPGVLRAVGAVQLDTISTLARSHELVAYARLGAVGRPAVERAYWGRPSRTFEYWAHAACVLPVADWPWFGFRRRRHAASHAAEPLTAAAEVLARLSADGPLTATELGGAKNGGPWWDWSDAKHATERLLAAGEVVCVERRGWRRVYDLADRAIPAQLRAHDPDDTACIRELVRRAGQHLAVATEQDLADYYRLTSTQVRAVVRDAGLVPVTVAGWRQRAWADRTALDLLAARRGRHRTTLLSPFDSLVWDRRRTERVFGFTHRLEAYLPREQRVHGYFTMPLLAGGRLVGRVDPARDGQTLVVRRATILPGAEQPLAAALFDAARWVGATTIRVEHLEPAALRPQVSSLLAASGA